MDGVRQKFTGHSQAAVARVCMCTGPSVFFRDRLHVSVMNLRSSVKRARGFCAHADRSCSMRLVNVSLNHDRLTNNELNRQKKWSAVTANINLWCQKQCDAIYETERGAGSPTQLSIFIRTMDLPVLLSFSLVLLHFLTPSVFSRTKRETERRIERWKNCRWSILMCR